MIDMGGNKLYEKKRADDFMGDSPAGKYLVDISWMDLSNNMGGVQKCWMPMYDHLNMENEV